jgi:hypothetical protein
MNRPELFVRLRCQEGKQAIDSSAFPTFSRLRRDCVYLWSTKMHNICLMCYELANDLEQLLLTKGLAD